MATGATKGTVTKENNKKETSVVLPSVGKTSSDKKEKVKRREGRPKKKKDKRSRRAHQVREGRQLGYIAQRKIHST